MLEQRRVAHRGQLKQEDAFPGNVLATVEELFQPTLSSV
jgi:hypothetical protein